MFKLEGAREKSVANIKNEVKLSLGKILLPLVFGVQE